MLISEKLLPQNKRLTQQELFKFENYSEGANSITIKLAEYHKALEALEKEIKSRENAKKGINKE